MIFIVINVHAKHCCNSNLDEFRYDNHVPEVVENSDVLLT